MPPPSQIEKGAEPASLRELVERKRELRKRLAEFTA
jgi:hypothetical protein